MPTAGMKRIDPDAFLREQAAKGNPCTVGGAGVPAAGPSAARPANGRRETVLTAAPRRLVIEVDVPIRLKSEANAGGRLGAKLGRKAAVKEAVAAALPGGVVMPMPVGVTLTRYGVKELDGDNLARAMKSCRDVVAGWLGLDDADRRIKWRYRQAAAFTPFCRIRIEHKGRP